MSHVQDKPQTLEIKASKSMCVWEREILLLSNVKYDLWDQKHYVSRNTCESK